MFRYLILPLIRLQRQPGFETRNVFGRPPPLGGFFTSVLFRARPMGGNPARVAWNNCASSSAA